MAATIIIKFETEAEIEAMQAAIDADAHLNHFTASYNGNGEFEAHRPSNETARRFNACIEIARAAAPVKPALAEASIEDQPATEKQIAFIKKLVAKDPAYASNFISSTAGITKARASQVIEILIAGA